MYDFRFLIAASVAANLSQALMEELGVLFFIGLASSGVWSSSRIFHCLHSLLG